MNIITVFGLMTVVCGGSLFIGTGIGHLQGYRKGFEDGAREQAGKWKDRMAQVMRHNNIKDE